MTEDAQREHERLALVYDGHGGTTPGDVARLLTRHVEPRPRCAREDATHGAEPPRSAVAVRAYFAPMGEPSTRRLRLPGRPHGAHVARHRAHSVMRATAAPRRMTSPGPARHVAPGPPHAQRTPNQAPSSRDRGISARHPPPAVPRRGLARREPLPWTTLRELSVTEPGSSSASCPRSRALRRPRRGSTTGRSPRRP